MQLFLLNFNLLSLCRVEIPEKHFRKINVKITPKKIDVKNNAFLQGCVENTRHWAHTPTQDSNISWKKPVICNCLTFFTVCHYLFYIQIFKLPNFQTVKYNSQFQIDYLFNLVITFSSSLSFIFHLIKI